MAVVIAIDGVDCTACVQTGSVTRRLNRPAQATCRMFTDCAPGDANSHLKVTIDGNLFFHGFVTQISTEAGEDGNLMSEYSAQDPMFLWNFRPARSGPDSTDGPPGDFSNPDLFQDPSPYGPQILQQILLQSEDDSDPGVGEGPLYIDVGGGSFAAGVTNLAGAPTDYPMTIMEVFNLLSSTGTVDAVLSPIDAGGNMASIAVVNGDYGNNHSNFSVYDENGTLISAGDGTVTFEYATGDQNVRALRMTEDSSNICNKLWYYLGPRRKTAMDPAGDQHWAGNITGQDGGSEDDDGPFPGPPFGLAYTDDALPGPGGQAVDSTNSPNFGTHGANDTPAWDGNPLGEIIYNSRINSGVRMDVQIFDAQGDENPSKYRELYRRLWQTESWLRAIPRVLVHVTPVRTSDFDLLPPGVVPVTFGDFDIGDLVTVTAGSVVRGGFTGAQRIYEYTVTWDEDGILELGELLVSSDQDGAQT